MAVPANICVAWPSTVGLIPAGWTRETSLDSRYILGAGTGADTDLVTDRGNTSHTHTSPAHTPTQNAHTHTFSNPGGDADNTIVSGVLGGGGVASDAGHGHDGTLSASATGTNNSSTITIDTTPNDLAFVEVIWIKSDGTPVSLPANCLAFFASDSLPSGWSRVHGDRYLKGATSGGGGGTTGGSNTHTHTSPAHTHTQNVHSHGAVSSSAGNTALGERGTGPDTPASVGHTHSVSLSGITPTNQSVTTTIDAASSEPPFKKLNVVTPGSASLPTDIIALWLGAHASIPADWSRFTDMDGLWLKAANANGESNVTTGGASQHSHTASDCQPIQNAHSHTAIASGSTGTIGAASSAHNTFAADGHNHPTWNVTNETPTNNSVAVTVDSCTADAALPKHRTVIYVRFTGSTPPTPGPSITGRTTYDAIALNVENLYTVKDPAVTQKIWRGDRRFTKEE